MQHYTATVLLFRQTWALTIIVVVVVHIYYVVHITYYFVHTENRSFIYLLMKYEGHNNFIDDPFIFTLSRVSYYVMRPLKHHKRRYTTHIMYPESAKSGACHYVCVPVGDVVTIIIMIVDRILVRGKYVGTAAEHQPACTKLRQRVGDSSTERGGSQSKHNRVPAYQQAAIRRRNS